MKELTVEQLKAWRDENKDFQLIDVRESHELEIATIGGLHIPLGDITSHFNDIEDDKSVVVMCRSGKRSASAIHLIEQNLEGDFYNLKGGILAWADEIDNSLKKY